MDFKEITELIKTMSDSEVTSLEIQENGTSIKLEKQNNKVIYKESMIENSQYTKSYKTLDDNVKVEELQDIKDVNENLYIVKSPIVGTFYAASAPDKEPFVKVGNKVKKGDTLCIIEAMKLMNEVESEVDGEVVEVCCKDGDMMEFESAIFKIRINN